MFYRSSEKLIFVGEIVQVLFYYFFLICYCSSKVCVQSSKMMELFKKIIASIEHSLLIIKDSFFDRCYSMKNLLSNSLILRSNKKYRPGFCFEDDFLIYDIIE